MLYDWKNVLALAGVVAGYLSFIRLLLGDIRDWRKKPRLRIEFNPKEDLREWDLLGAHRKQKVATVHVRNERGIPALRCVAVLKLISSPPGATMEEKEFVLHWADTNYTAHTNTAEPVEIGFERRRLDVVFAVLFEEQASPMGAWVAIPIALSMPASATQAYLQPGEYLFRLIVKCANGKGASKDFWISSPATWTGLSMRPQN